MKCVTRVCNLLCAKVKTKGSHLRWKTYYYNFYWKWFKLEGFTKHLLLKLGMKQPSGYAGFCMADTIPYMSSHKVQVAAKITNAIKPLDSVYEWSSFTQSRKENKKKMQKVLYRIRLETF